MSFKSGCLVCGKELIYQQETKPLKCFYCGVISETLVFCPDGHYICDLCHSKSANDLIRDYCIQSELKNPIIMAFSLMDFPSVKTHGPEHHFLVPAVLLSAYYNTIQKPDLKFNKINQAYKRAEYVPGGFCGTHGNCGAAVGTGIFISLITESTSLSVKEWQLSNLITAKSLMGIALSGGPRCCKRDSYLAIIEAVSFVKEHFGVELEMVQPVICKYSAMNKQCLKEKCAFYPNNSSLIQIP